MLKIKNYFKFLILFLLFFLFVEVLTNIQMRERYENVLNYTVNVSSPKVIVEESKASYYSGYIFGYITNDTGKHIKDRYLQFNFYDNDGMYVGTEVKEIKYFNVDEKVKFDIQYNYKNVNRIEIIFTDNVVKPQTKTSKIFSIIDINSILP